MKVESTRDPISGVAGKIISSAMLLNDVPELHGVLLQFTDGTELSIEFYSNPIVAEVQHYRWLNGEVIPVSS